MNGRTKEEWTDYRDGVVRASKRDINMQGRRKTRKRKGEDNLQRVDDRRRDD